MGLVIRPHAHRAVICLVIRHLVLVYNFYNTTGSATRFRGSPGPVFDLPNRCTTKLEHLDLKPALTGPNLCNG